VTDEAIALLAPRIGTRAACTAVGIAQATWYRRHRASPAATRRPGVPHRDRAQPRALTAAERRAILDMLHSPRFADTSPAEAWATLLDEGTYLGSQSTFYRLLRQRARPANGARRPRTRLRSSPSWSPPDPTASGRGTSPSCTARRSGPTTTCT
jgi:putative transposase